jgi:hypothetical protein
MEIEDNLKEVFARYMTAVHGFYVAKAALEVVPEYALTPTSKHTVGEFVLHHRSLVAHSENLKRNFDEASKHAKVLSDRNAIAINNDFIKNMLLQIVANEDEIESFNRSVLFKFWQAKTYYADCYEDAPNLKKREIFETTKSDSKKYSAVLDSLIQITNRLVPPDMIEAITNSYNSTLTRSRNDND